MMANAYQDMSKEELIKILTMAQKTLESISSSNFGMTNDSAIGYAILAMEDIIIDQDIIYLIRNRMLEIMDIKTECEAECFYHDKFKHYERV